MAQSLVSTPSFFGGPAVVRPTLITFAFKTTLQAILFSLGAMAYMAVFCWRVA
jgi:hypothetical protein